MTDFPSSPETKTPEFLYARDLLVSFVEEHCDPVPEWRPNSDLMGILVQFDNALTVVRSIKAGFDPKQPRDHAPRPIMHRIPIDKLAFCFGVSIEQALKAQGDIGHMYRELASSPDTSTLCEGE